MRQARLERCRHALLMLLAPPGDETPRWATAYAEVRDWVDGALDTEGARYKPELSRLLWPLFAYTYLELLRAGAREQAGRARPGQPGGA